ncbi:hypothetical protein BH23ACT9_BH23ACT9_08230 [soil metagenome]
MGLFDKMKEKGRGIVTAAKPDEGVAPASAEEVTQRLQAIQGKGISTTVEDDEIVVAWAARISSAGVDGAATENLYRAIKLSLDAKKQTVTGLCLKTTTTGELSFGGRLTATGNWERGQHIGTEKVHVLAWLGPHQTSGGADEAGYTFSWSELREPVMAAVTGAGWTYKPKKV